MKRKGVIYKYTFADGNVYIGQTRRDPQIRHREHLDPTLGPVNVAFWSAYQEQGEPKYEILETHECEDVDELVNILNQRETFYIHLYKATDPNYGYNKVATGMVTGRLNKKLQKLETKIRHKLYELRKPLWDSMLLKIDNIETMSDEEKSIYNYYFVEINPFYHKGESDDFILEHWYDFAQFCFEDDIETSAGEYIIENLAYIQDEYVDDDEIFQLDLDGNIIAKYENQADAATALGVKNSANINNVIRGKQKTAHGYKWIKVKDYKPNNQLTLWD